MSETTAIFLHGGPGFKDYLKPFFQDLSSHFKCIFYDQAKGPEVEIGHLLSQLDLHVDASSQPVILVGHSWGAVLAIEYAARYPQKVSGLAMICSGLSHDHWFTEYQKEKEHLGLLNASAEEIFLAPHERAEGKALLDNFWETFSEETFESLNKTYLVDYDLIAKFSTLQIPVLNIFGEMDIRFPSRITKTFSAYNPNVVNLEVKKTGHFPFVQREGRELTWQAPRTAFAKY